jgi:Holliday junction resolvase
MEFDLILSKYCEHNQIGMMLCKKFKAKISLILLEEKNKEKFEDLREVYRELLPNCEVKGIIIKHDDIATISDLFIKYKNNKILINLTGGNEITSLILLKKALEMKVDSTYVDLLNMKRYVFGENIKVIEEELEDLKIEDITRFSGADIISDSDELALKKDIILLTKLIANNLELWEKHKSKLYDKNIFVHDYKNPSKVIINKNELTIEEQELLWKILNYIRNLGGINYSVDKYRIHVKFKNDYLKGFIFKSGTWLEVLTNIIIKDIKEIDEVKSGVEFFWSNGSQDVKNELDVVAIKDSVLICISCKDSEKYDESALNELEVHSDKLGGEDVVKILVATKLPLKKSIIDRAKEMNIKIVILNKSIGEFKEKLINIINNSMKNNL